MMREFRERSYFRKIFFSRFVFFVFLILVVFTGSSVLKAYKKSQKAVLRNEEIEKDLEDLLERKSGLESSINRLRSPLGVEKELREKFQVKKPDEEFVVIVEDNTGVSEVSSGAGEEESLLQKAKNFFKNLF